MYRSRLSVTVIWLGVAAGPAGASMGKGLSWASVAPVLGPGAVVLGVVGLAVAGWYLRKRA